MLKSDVYRHFESLKRTLPLLDSIAEVLGVTKQAVSMWPDVVPQGMAYKLQVLTGGQLQVDPSLYKPQKRPHKRKPESADDATA